MLRNAFRHGVLHAVANILVCTGLGIGLIAVTSRIVSDRALLTQYLFWTPLLAYALVMGGCLVLSLLSGMGYRVSQRARRPVHEWRSIGDNQRIWWRLVALLASSCALVGLWGWWVLRTPGSMTPTSANSAELRLLHWNLSSPDTHTWSGVMTDVRECREADVLLLGVTMSDEQFSRVMQPLAATHQIRRMHTLAIASRYPIQNLRQIDLKLDDIVRPSRVDGATAEPWYQTVYNDHAEQLGISRREFGLSDPGDIIAFTVVTPAGPVGVWFIDLPSSPFASRHRIATATVAHAHAAGLQPPHAVVGDFNMPSGSHSLKLIAPGYRSAADAALDDDAGPTWPRGRPLLQIDHALIHPNTSTRVYRTFDPGLSDHWGQFLIITPGGVNESESVTADR